MLAAACLGEDPALLDLLVEAAEGALEGLVLTHSDFCQSRFTSSGLVSKGRPQLVGRSARMASARAQMGARRQAGGV
jgi:hypothetical protein